MDLHVIGTIGEYAFRRVMGGWFIRLLVGAAILMLVTVFWGGPNAQEALLKYRAIAMELATLAGMLLIAVMGATELPRDIDTQVILILLSKPLSKADVVAGKFLGLAYVGFFTILTLTLVIAGGCFAQGMMSEGEITQGISPDWNLFQKACFGFCQCLLLASAVVFFSTRLNEIPILFCAAIYTAFGYFIMYLPILVGASPMPAAASFALQGAYYFVPNLWYLQIPPDISELGHVGLAHFGLALVYSLVYTAILLLLAIRSFESRQLVG